MIEIPERVALRAFERWVPNGAGCHISTYSTQSSGYAQIGWREAGSRTVTTAHRAAWVHVHGQITDDMDVDHIHVCDRRCVNVDHLRLLTPQQNRRQQGRDYPLGFCKRGHPDSERIQNHRGAWICPKCKKQTTHESYLRLKQQRR